MTPVEIEWELTAFAARERRAMERLDDQAWLTGRYAAIGVNAPRRFPRRPDGVPRAPAQMDDGEMKRVFLNLQRRQAAESGGVPGGEE